MADIRKRKSKDGSISYQVRYPSEITKSGYAYKSFQTKKDARFFLQSLGSLKEHTGHFRTMPEAVDSWLEICEKEGLNGREPVTRYTIKNYQYRANIIKRYPWPKELHLLQAPDIVEFRSWLLRQEMSRDLARKVLASLQSVMKEMTLRGIIATNVASGVSIREESRYREPVVIPTKQDVLALLAAADRLSNSKNQQIARTWRRYRPIMYLAADSGMRPQEYLALSKSAIKEDGVVVDRAIEGDGGKISVTKTPAGRRFIELSQETLDLLLHYAENHAPENDYDLVFPSSNGRWQCRRNWQRRGFDVACHEAGLTDTVILNGKPEEKPKYRPYDLRHFFASMLFGKRTNLKKIQVMMGHTNIETTLNVYGHLLEEDDPNKNGAIGMLSGILENTCGESVAKMI